MVAKKKKSKTHEVLVWKASCGDALGGGKSIMFSQVCSETVSAFGRHCIEWILSPHLTTCVPSCTSLRCFLPAWSNTQSIYSKRKDHEKSIRIQFMKYDLYIHHHYSGISRNTMPPTTSKKGGSFPGPQHPLRRQRRVDGALAASDAAAAADLGGAAAAAAGDAGGGAAPGGAQWPAATCPLVPWRNTLWLCQNSYWKWPFIVDFSIENGDFP